MKITSVKQEMESEEFGSVYVIYFSNGGKLGLIRFKDTEESTLELIYDAINLEPRKEKYRKLSQFIKDLQCLQKMAKKLSAEIGDECDMNISGNTIKYYIKLTWKDSHKIAYHELIKV